MKPRRHRPPTLPPGQAGRLDPLCDRFESEWLAGGRPRLEDFLPLVEEADRPALLRELLAIELDYRRRLGEQPTAEEYRPRLPAYAALLDEAFDLPFLGLTGPLLSLRPERPPLAEEGVADQALLLQAGRYVIEGEIARGGMGAVLRARDHELNRAL